MGTHHGKPGAYSLAGPSQNRRPGDTVTYRVVVPPNIRPNQQFRVMAGGVDLMVTCPSGVRPGDQLTVNVPYQQTQQPTAGGAGRGGGGGATGGRGQIYSVRVPQGVQPGGRFQVLVNSQPVSVQCPPNVQPGEEIRIQLPETTAAPELPQQMFEVTVPNGVRPGQPFALIANEQRVMVHCPCDARPGQKIRFKLPIKLSESQLQAYSIHYDKDGWVRCVGTDLRFHWARSSAAKKGVTAVAAPSGSTVGTDKGESKIEEDSTHNNNNSISMNGSAPSFDVVNSAFVRVLTREKAPSGAPGATERSATWSLTFGRAEDVSLEASVPEVSLTFQTLSRVSGQTFPQKLAWFRSQCDHLRIHWDVEHQLIRVRRSALLDDSMRAIESVRPEQLRERFRFEFLGEPGVDAGGVAREWFQLCSEQLFNPDIALFQYSSINQMCMQINPSSGQANDEHLQYFHFAGRLLGKALFDGQLVQCHLVRPLYKHLLAWPVSFADLEHMDHYVHDSLLKMLDMPNVEDCCVYFQLSMEFLGQNTTVELKPGGESILVTNANLAEYMELVLKHKMVERIRPQLTSFLVGFYEVIPEALISVFDFQELELLMCGLPVIDLEDWKRHTDYVGELEKKGAAHKVAKWFWEVLEEIEPEQKARLLQFVTGTSGVPSQGFAVLQGNDGNVRKFTINGSGLEHGLFPRAHTCFNRIDLPMYSSKEDLKQYLVLAIQLECTGFDID